MQGHDCALERVLGRSYWVGLEAEQHLAWGLVQRHWRVLGLVRERDSEPGLEQHSAWGPGPEPEQLCALGPGRGRGLVLEQHWQSAGGRVWEQHWFWDLERVHWVHGLVLE